jgi:hypothetical protein
MHDEAIPNNFDLFMPVAVKLKTMLQNTCRQPAFLLLKKDASTHKNKCHATFSERPADSGG